MMKTVFWFYVQFLALQSAVLLYSREASGPPRRVVAANSAPGLLHRYFVKMLWAIYLM
jgi:hypothetical protein